MVFRCPFHKINIRDGPCPECDAEYEARRDALLMTPQERVDEMEKWFGNILTIEFNKLHKRIEELVGRPVYTHEMVSEDALVSEILSGNVSTPEDVIKKAVDIFGEDNTLVVECEKDEEVINGE